MVYTSKRRRFRDFLKTRNWKYYAAFFLFFIALIAVIVVINYRYRNNSNKQNTTVEETTTSNDVLDESNNSIGRYKLSINMAVNQITVYNWIEDEAAYSEQPCRYMICSVNQSLKEGSYSSVNSTSVKNSWINDSDETFYRYYTDYGNGISFHTAKYSENKNKNSLVIADYNTIGQSSENSGITLLCDDAKWIYENCSNDSEIYIYSDDTEEISDTVNDIITIPAGITWDPTDYSSGSPWCQTKLQSISANNKVTVVSNIAESQLLNYVTALDEDNNNVNVYVYITGKYDLSKAGTYSITYNIADIYGSYLTKSVTLIVEEAPTQEETTTEEETTSIEETTSAKEEETTTNTEEPASEDETEPETTTEDEEIETTSEEEKHS